MNDQNMLADETSPYLLEHADNPVNWYPWCDEALERARDEDKPIFLSIGYSACHWCHVMKRESFQDPDTAELMNELFVNIKVDREERPDLDEIYMQAVQSMTGRGGWPMSVFLTPELKPFYGGTYFPPEPRQGMPDFRTVLERVHQTYDEKRNDVEESAEKISKRLKQMEHTQSGSTVAGDDLLEQTYDTLQQRFDREWGGFGDAPKFPRSMDLQLLLRHAVADNSAEAREMVQITLDRMSQGGLYDQVGGGFSRYSTDKKWLVPHFEKMLYDNAMLTDLYSQAYQVYEKSAYRDVVYETVEYLDREMTSPDGAFYSSQDAESDGEEGKYYVWSHDEFFDVLGEDADRLAEFWGVTESGNFEGKNILHISEPVDEFCESRDVEVNEFKQTLKSAREKLLDVREDRIKPHRDEKILTDWNALMASALGRAGFVFDDDQFLAKARASLEFLQTNLVEDDLLYHTHREGETHTPGFLDDYAFFVKASIQYFEATGDESWLETAVTWFDRACYRFLDDENGGFFYTDDQHTDLIVRSKNPQDKSQPSGNSEMVLNALKLAALTGDRSYRGYAEDCLTAFDTYLDRAPESMTRMLCGLFDFHSQSTEIVSIGDRAARDDLLQPLRRKFIPGSVVYPASADSSTKFTELLDGRLDGPSPAVYVCQNGTCRRPATAEAELNEELESL